MMKKFFNCVLLLSFGLSLSIFAKSGQMIVGLDNEIYNEIDMIYSLGNKLQPSFSRPWILSELDYYIDNIDRENMGKIEKILYAKILKDRKEIDTSYQLDDRTRLITDITLNSQFYIHNNPIYALSDNTTSNNSLYEWNEGALDDRLSLIEFDGSLSFLDNFYWYISLEYGNSKFNPITKDNPLNSYYINDTSSSLSILSDISDAVDIYYPLTDPYYSSYFSNNMFDSNRDLKAMGPYRNYFSISSDPLSFTFARSKLNFGESIVGNFILDKSQHYYDYTNLSYYSQKFKVSWLNVFFDTQYTTLQEEKFNGYKMLMITKFEIQLLKNLSFSFTDGMMYEAKTLSFTNMNPTYFYHNLNNRDVFNAIANFEFSYQYSRGLSFYFQFVVDQLKLPTEAATSEPSSVGLLVGGKKVIDFDDYIIDFKFEAGFSSPMLYKRDRVDFLVFNRYFTNSSDDKFTYVHDLNYVGFPYGGDSIFSKLEMNYYSLKNYDFKSYYFLLLKGPSNILSKYNQNISSLPNDIRYMRNIIYIKANYKIESQFPVTLSSSISFVDDYIFETKKNSFDIELVLSSSIKF